MTDRELMRKALNALCWYSLHYWRPPEVDDAIAELRARLDQPEACAPVAWVRNLTDPHPHCVTDLNYRSVADGEVDYIPLYARLPERKLQAVNAAVMKMTADLVYLRADENNRVDHNEVMQLVTNWRCEWDRIMAQPDCYGDGNVYRGVRSKDSATRTVWVGSVGESPDSTKPVVEREAIEQALQECEKSYLIMVEAGTPEYCQKHEDARDHFWRTLENRK